MRTWYRPVIIPTLTFALLALSATVNVLQAQRIRALISPVPNTPAVIGHTVSAIQGYGTTGQGLEIALKGSVPTILYFFSPTCTWCERNWSNVRALHSAAKGRYRILLASSSRGLDAFMQERGLTMNAIEGISDSTRRDLGLSATPHTIVISAEGLVTHAWTGAFTDRPKQQLEQLLNISLPGLDQLQNHK
jgi:hypothetical protein